MEQTFTTPGRLRLEMRIPAGSIRIKAEETTTTQLSIRGERDPDDIRIVFDDARADEQHLTVEHKERGKRFGWRGDELRVDMTVPVGTLVSCDTGSADLAITGQLGTLDFRSGSGDLRFDDIDGEVNAKVASGDLAGGNIGGWFSFMSASGDARVRDVGGEVSGKSASGDVSIGSASGSVRVTTVSGDVEIGSVASGSTSVRSVSGDVEIGVARGTRVYLDLGSTSGDTVSELDMSESAAEGGGTGLELQVGTVSGDIRVVRAAAGAGARYAAEDSASAE
jgi:DUF4097 and DUF4098 domain-containing protein YvlB